MARENMLRDPNLLKALAEDIFGEERVDFSFSKIGNNETYPRFSYAITVHFPEIILSNSAGHNHKINDLFVTLRGHVKASDVELNVTGTRTTYSLKEFQSHYTHSHLDTDALHGYSHFCLGASDFYSLVTKVQMEGTVESWEFLLLSLSNYVSWESREGGPFMHFKNIAYQTGNSPRQAPVSENQLIEEFSRLIKFFPNEVFEFNPEPSLIPNHPKLWEFFNKYSTIRKMRSGSNNTITQQSLDNAMTSLRNGRGGFTFKGKQIPYKVWDENISPEMATSATHIEKEVYNWYVNYASTQISNLTKQIQYESIKRSGNERIRTLIPY